MNRRSLSMTVALLGGLVALPVVAGCASSELISVRNDMSKQLPDAQIRGGRSFAVGAVGLGLARTLGSLVMERDEPVRVILRGVRRVHVGQYRVDGHFDAANLRMPTVLQRRVDHHGWDHLATVRQDGEAVWVLYRSRGPEITDLFVTVLSEDQLVMTRVSGRLSSTLIDLLRESNVRLPVLIPSLVATGEDESVIAARTATSSE